MNESLSVGETSSAPRKRRGKYCAAFDCNNSAYNVNGTRTSYHFFEFPKDAQLRNRWCSLIKRRHGQDGFVVSTATVLCHEHFRAEDISKKLSGRWNLKTECSSALGMESGCIKDAEITASSQWDGNHAATQGRLNFKAGGGKTGGWSARQNNGNQWIQVALGSYTKLTSTVTQGGNAHSQWVTAYKLQYSEDGVTFYYYKVSGQSSPKSHMTPQPSG